MSLDVIFSSGEIKDVEFEYKGEKIVIKVRELGWSERNKILSKCFTYQGDGSITFDFEKYHKESLKKIITSAPWGETNEMFFARISPGFGSLLEKLVPKAFEEMKTSDFFVKE